MVKQQLFQLIKKIPLSIYILFFAKVIMTVGNFVYPFLSLYLTQKAGLSEYYTGIIIMCTAFTCVFGSVAGGTLADFFSRKYIIVASLLLSGLCYIFVPFVHNTFSIITLISLSLAFLAASEPAFNSIIADLTEKELRKEAYSMTYWGANIGFAVGPLIAGFLFNYNIDFVFWGDGLATLFSAVLIFIFVGNPAIIADDDDDDADTSEKEAQEPAAKMHFISSVIRNPLIVMFCIFFTAHAFIYSQTNFALPLHLRNLFGQSGTELYGILMTVNGISVILLTPVILKLTKKISAATCVATGIGLYAFGFGIYLFSGHVFWLVLSVIVWSAGEILSVTNAKVFIAEKTKPSQRGRYNIFLDISFEAGYGLGPGLMGKVITALGMIYAWIIIVAVSIISSLSIFFIGKAKKLQKNNC